MVGTALRLIDKLVIESRPSLTLLGMPCEIASVRVLWVSDKVEDFRGRRIEDVQANIFLRLSPGRNGLYRDPPAWLNADVLQRLAELHGHLISPVTDRSGADHLANMTGGGVAMAGDFDLAVLPDGKLLAEQERHAAEGKIPDEDIVDSVGGGAFKNSKESPALEGSASVSTPVSFRKRGPWGRSEGNFRYATHASP
jgi:hypothetical protein